MHCHNNNKSKKFTAFCSILLCSVWQHTVRIPITQLVIKLTHNQLASLLIVCISLIECEKEHFIQMYIIILFVLCLQADKVAYNLQDCFYNQFQNLEL